MTGNNGLDEMVRVVAGAVVSSPPLLVRLVILYQQWWDSSAAATTGTAGGLLRYCSCRAMATAGGLAGGTLSYCNGGRTVGRLVVCVGTVEDRSVLWLRLVVCSEQRISREDG